MDTQAKYQIQIKYDLDAIQALQKQGLQVYADTVLNHRLGGDESEVAKATPFSDHNRLHPKGEPQDIKAYTHYTFPGRQGKHSDFQWHWWHFDAVDYDDDQCKCLRNSFSLIMKSKFVGRNNPPLPVLFTIFGLPMAGLIKC